LIPTIVQVTGVVAGAVGGTAITTGPPISFYINKLIIGSIKL
jgi:hypothetical protein